MIRGEKVGGSMRRPIPFRILEICLVALLLGAGLASAGANPAGEDLPKVLLEQALEAKGKRAVELHVASLDAFLRQPQVLSKALPGHVYLQLAYLTAMGHGSDDDVEGIVGILREGNVSEVGFAEATGDIEA